MKDVLDRSEGWKGPWADLRDWACIVLMDQMIDDWNMSDDEIVAKVRPQLEPILLRLEKAMSAGRGERTMNEVLDNMEDMQL